jgi:hypothetical protein
VHERLAHLAEGDLAGGHEDGARHPGARGVGRRARAGVSGRGADDRLRPSLGSLRDRDRHAAVLERTGGVRAFDLEPHSAAGQLGDDGGPDERCAAFAERYDGGVTRDREPVAVGLDHTTPTATMKGCGHRLTSLPSSDSPANAVYGPVTGGIASYREPDDQSSRTASTPTRSSPG